MAAIAKGESRATATGAVTAGPPSEGSMNDRCVTMLLVSDLHGLVDGVTRGAKRVGGVDGLVHAIREVESLKGLQTDGDMYLFVGGDMIREYSNRRVSETNALGVWNQLLADLAISGRPLPDGVTFGNHELEFKDVLAEQLLTLHCHNLELDPKTEPCAYRKCKVHYNAVCEQVKSGDDQSPIRFCGVTTGEPRPGSGAVVSDPHAAAADCPHHWDAKKDDTRLRILLAHYSFRPPRVFAKEAPPGYHVIFKAHDHNGGSNIPSDGEEFQLPVVAEPQANGGSVGVLKLWFADGTPRRASFEQRGAYPPGMTPWTVDKQLQEAQEDIVYAGDFLPFGGAAEKNTLYLRWRGIQLGLRGMEFACQPDKLKNHAFLMSATAVRDYSMVPGAHRAPNRVDTWDLKATFGESVFRERVTARTVKGKRADLVAALGELLRDRDQRIVPWEYTDVPRVFLRFDGSVYCVTLEDGDPKASPVSGESCVLGDEQLDLRSLFPDAELHATMPSWEAGLVEKLTRWRRMKTKDRVELCRPGMHDIPIWECVARLLAESGCPDLFHC